MSWRITRDQRWSQLATWSKESLIGWYRQGVPTPHGTFIGSTEPASALRKWRKEELINSIVNAELEGIGAGAIRIWPNPGMPPTKQARSENTWAVSTAYSIRSPGPEDPSMPSVRDGNTEGHDKARAVRPSIVPETPSPIEVRLTRMNRVFRGWREISENATVHHLDDQESVSMGEAQLKVTGWYIRRGYIPVGCWEYVPVDGSNIHYKSKGRWVTAASDPYAVFLETMCRFKLAESRG